MSNARRSKERAIFWGDTQQHLYGNFQPDVVLKDKGGSFTILEVKHHGRSGEHIIPRDLLIRSVSEFVAKPDKASQLIVPDIAQKLLPFILRKKLLAAVAGDLAEDFQTYATKWGRPYALYWLWWELGGLCVRRFGPSAIITGVGMWFRQWLGW